MAEYHVGIGFAGAIYAGTLTMDKKRWANKSDVTDEVVAAFGSGYKNSTKKR